MPQQLADEGERGPHSLVLQRGVGCFAKLLLPPCSFNRPAAPCHVLASARASPKESTVTDGLPETGAVENWWFAEKVAARLSGGANPLSSPSEGLGIHSPIL